MNNIYLLNNKTILDNINLGDPYIQRDNVYFSKILNNEKKLIYIQLPKCNIKDKIKKSNKLSVYTCELLFDYNLNKSILEYIENIEELCLKNIYNNKDLWFYDSENINLNDIEELYSSIIKIFSKSEHFIFKTYIRENNILAYDNEDNVIDYLNIEKNAEVIPLVSLNGIKFYNKTFFIDVSIKQLLVLNTQQIERKFLIQNNEYMKETKKNVEHTTDNSNNKIISNKVTKHDQNHEDNSDVEDNSQDEDNKDTKDTKDTKDNQDNSDHEDNPYDEDNKDSKDNQDNELDNDNKDDKYQVKFNNDEDDKKDKQYNDKEEFEDKKLKKNNEETEENINYISDDILFNLTSTNNEYLTVKSREEIYLDLYKDAKRKAKEIRKNAIEAFLEAKNIKSKYNLESLVNNDSSDDEEFLNL